MTKFHLYVFCFFAAMANSQTIDYSKAPNSYIFDLDLAHSNNYGGIQIPVEKAYQVWSNYEYLKVNGASAPIPHGTQTAALHWEDVPGLIQSVAIIPNSDPAKSKINVAINKGKGKGNAVVTLKVNQTVYWSWHIWVTDNPESGVVYNHGTETDINGNLISIQYMDRNLGATSNSFLTNQWQKSGGLMYEWGRKDPFPPLVYKDSDFYEISGEVGTLRHPQIDPAHTIPVEIRPFDDIGSNMRYAVHHPLTYIINSDSNGNWFSRSRYKTAGASPNYITWDLWSDNAKGGNSNGNSSNTALRTESRSYELKSELDPCPNGWRIPSYYGRETQNNNLAFFGKHDWNNDDNVIAHRQLFPNSPNPNLAGIKVYPGLGMNLTQAQNGQRNLGVLSISGGYVYYPNSGTSSVPKIVFQDNVANGGLWSATYAYDGARIFSMISDPARTNTAVGLHALLNNQTNPTRSGNAVKCMRDPNLAAIGNFGTEYFASNETNFTEGLDQPNSYIVLDQTNLQIPVSKAFSVHNQLLSNQEILPSDNLIAKVLWSTNTLLVRALEIKVNPADPKLSHIEVYLNSAQKGNAVISLHNGKPESPALWSWHIWAPEDDPTQNTVSYTTEAATPVAHHFINASTSNLPPLQTEFMDRNLGAHESTLASGFANGLHYQWGRKDPLPTFLGKQVAYTASDEVRLSSFTTPLIDDEDQWYMKLNDEQYSKKFAMSYDYYSQNEYETSKKVQENIRFSIENPLHFMYHKGLGAIYNGGNHYGNDLTQVRDWVSDQRAQGENRWGHADKKSPFDPCPEGWRVPDVSFTNLYTGSKGNSPWYNGYQNDPYGRPGIIQDQWFDIPTYYNGSVEGQIGWKLNNPNYSIGEFPRDGIRGEIGGKNFDLARSGVWTASLADMHTGFALALQFEGNRMQTGTGVYPQAAMSVRCAKDENRLLGTPANKKPTPIVVQDIAKKITVPAESAVVNIYPNPFKDEFFVSAKNADHFEMYDYSGKLVLKNTIREGKINAASTLKGIYILKIFFKDGSSVSKKLIKQ